MKNEIEYQVKELAKEAMRATQEYRLGEAAQEYLETQRKIMYTLNLEKDDIELHPTRVKLPFRGKEIVILPADEWEDYEIQYQEKLENLYQAYGIIDRMSDDLAEYRAQYDLSNYIKDSKRACDMDDFEWIRERFKDVYDEDLEDEEPEY